MFFTQLSAWNAQQHIKQEHSHSVDLRHGKSGPDTESAHLESGSVLDPDDFPNLTGTSLFKVTLGFGKSAWTDSTVFFLLNGWICLHGVLD